MIDTVDIYGIFACFFVCMFRIQSKNSQKGQALLIVILVMVVALTIGLSVASRTITNIRNTEDEEQSQAALSAAEAGIEEFIRQPCALDTCIFPKKNYTINNTSADITIKVASGAQVVMNQGNPVKKDEGGDIWLVPHSNLDGTPTWGTPWTGNLNVYWGKAADIDCQTAAVEIIVFRGSVNNPQTTRYVYDGCPARRNNNSFTNPGGGISFDGIQFKYGTTLAINQGLFVRVVPLYYNSVVGFTGTALPPQERLIESTGNAGDTQRKVTFVDRYPGLPSELVQYLQLSTY